jgi:ABC-2 type transport system ATP-binding protein
MFEVERLCDRVIILKRGRIEEDDSPARIMARYSRDTLEEVFLDVARGRAQGNVQGGEVGAPREPVPQEALSSEAMP